MPLLYQGIEINHFYVVAQCLHDGLARDARGKGRDSCEEYSLCHGCDALVVERGLKDEIV